MCMNCGCGQPHEDHGNQANITADALLRAGEANDQSLRESAQHIVETVALLDAAGSDAGGLAQPAGPGGGTGGGRGTPSTES